MPGIEERAFLDIDSLLRPVYGHAKEGASYGRAKVSGRTLLRKGLNPLVTTLSTAHAAPVVAEMRLRAGKTGSGRGAASQLRSAITTARACGATGKIMARGDSAFAQQGRHRGGDRRRHRVRPDHDP
ncbi:Mobile element protein (plasmid) [Rhodococcus sp. WAY2]|nr:Mobile element protein [Rhodococcus sp. WAY2]